MGESGNDIQRPDERTAQSRHPLTPISGDGGVGEIVKATTRPTLKQIQQPVKTELKEFQAYFKKSMKSDVKILDAVTSYVLWSKGKQVRPLLVFLTAKMCGGATGVTETTHQAAALVELLHTATLVHDDVVDEADERRGRFSINALWKNKISVLFGDFLLSRGLLLALENKSYELLHVVSDAVRRMSEGELLQIEKARHLDIDEETYYRIISDKTASLLSACTGCGAVSVTSDEQVKADMKAFGEHLGLAFQIKDDLFDFGDDDVGKPRGIDIKEKKMTLPLIHALSGAPATEQKRIKKLVRNSRKDSGAVAEVISFVRQSNGFEYAREKMYGHAAEAKSLLMKFPDSEARSALANLVDFVTERKK